MLATVSFHRGDYKSCSTYVETRVARLMFFAGQKTNVYLDAVNPEVIKGYLIQFDFHMRVPFLQVCISHLLYQGTHFLSLRLRCIKTHRELEPRQAQFIDLVLTRVLVVS